MVGEKMSAMDYVTKAIQNRIGRFTKTDILEMCPEIGRGSVENCLKALYEQDKIGREGKGRASFYFRKEI